MSLWISQLSYISASLNIKNSIAYIFLCHVFFTVFLLYSDVFEQSLNTNGINSIHAYGSLVCEPLMQDLQDPK